jgi:hypothetical protein
MELDAEERRLEEDLRQEDARLAQLRKGAVGAPGMGVKARAAAFAAALTQPSRQHVDGPSRDQGMRHGNTTHANDGSCQGSQEGCLPLSSLVKEVVTATGQGIQEALGMGKQCAAAGGAKLPLTTAPGVWKTR